MLLWVVRGTDDNGNDLTAVIEAATRAEAEYMALRRGLPVVIVSEATSRDVSVARANNGPVRFVAAVLGQLLSVAQVPFTAQFQAQPSSVNIPVNCWRKNTARRRSRRTARSTSCWGSTAFTRTDARRATSRD